MTLGLPHGLPMLQTLWFQCYRACTILGSEEKNRGECEKRPYEGVRMLYSGASNNVSRRYEKKLKVWALGPGPRWRSFVAVSWSDSTAARLRPRRGEAMGAAFFFGTVIAKWCHCVGLNLEGPHCTGPNRLISAIYRSKKNPGWELTGGVARFFVSGLNKCQCVV
jgi:hypothetical protein